MHQNLWEATKQVLREKKSSHINQLWFHSKKLVKEEKIKPKVNRE